MIANRNGTGEPITPAQGRVIEYLSHRDKVTKGDLAGCLRVSAPAITKVVRTLKRKGLVQQEEDAGDRRRVLVKLSNTGRELALSLSLTAGPTEKSEER